MLPELFRIGSFKVHTYGVLLIVGFLLGYWLAIRKARSFGIPTAKVSDLAMWALLGGIVGARLGWVLQAWDYYAKNPGQIARLDAGGMTSYGGIAAAIIVAWIWSRRNRISLANTLDMLAVPALVMHGFGRIGCFLNGCCYGSPCDLPWAVRTRADDGAIYMGHPAQIYDALMAFASAMLLGIYERRTFARRRVGEYAALFFVLYGVTRAVFEYFRAGYSSHSSLGLSLPDGQLVAFALIILGLVWYAVAKRQKPVANAD
jgi:phosphatidylglycerol:prolipoprotein diacylglycerol transferase